MFGLRSKALTAVMLMLACGGARADDTVKIGALYPLTGAAAGRGSAAQAAIEVAADIVNRPHKGLESLPLGEGRGLPKLGGAQVAIVFADHQDNPSVGQAQAVRLIDRDKVSALIGADAPAMSLAVAATAERRGVPLLLPASDAPDIAGRGCKWVFRTNPVGGDVAKIYVRFLDEQKTTGRKIDTVAMVFETGDRATSSAAAIREALKAAGYAIGADIGYPANALDLSPQVTHLRDTNPDVAIFVANTADAILLIKTMKTMDYRPPLAIGDGPGFSDPAFVAAVGNLAQGVVGRSVWNAGAPDSATAIVSGLYKAKTGRDLDDAAARTMQGFFVLADAIDRAGSAEPEAIRTALRDTDLKPEQLIVGYRGVKFGDTGQNVLAASYLTQLHGKGYVAVWPEASAAAKLELPYRGWQ